MAPQERLRLDEIELRVCEIASEQLGIARHKISPTDRIVEDLNCDSLDLVELFLEVEEELNVTLPETPCDSVYKAVFTRREFRLADLAELAYLQQGTGTPDRSSWQWRSDRRNSGRTPDPVPSVRFSQLDGRWEPRRKEGKPLWEPLEMEVGRVPQYRRNSDGMRCLLIPSASVEIGSDFGDAPADEEPRHVVEIDAFLIDAEPVSATAYCRFLNSIGEVDPHVLADWFVLGPDDDRSEHMPIECVGTEWRPRPGTHFWPMILVSWYGANAYSLWANDRSWSSYRCDADAESESRLPTEAQWEYAARGPRSQAYPWGDEPPSQTRACYGQHRRSAKYRVDTLPMENVNAALGMSPFGLHHMAGNVWQWCRDWYDPTFYAKPEATRRNAVNQGRARARSERGGSWVGPAELCRSSFRRGRPPSARGRCLGFRCIGTPKIAR